MSVIRFKPETLLRLGATIESSEKMRERFFDHTENLKRQLYANIIKDQQRYLSAGIVSFLDRLYIANQCAYIYEYEDADRTISRLVVTRVLPYSLSDFIKEAESLRYNLYTNSGRVFLGEEDLDRLDRMIDAAKDLIIEGYERKGKEEEVET